MIIKLLALITGSFLLIRLYFIAGGIPVSVIAYSSYTNQDYKTIIKYNPQHAYAYEELAKYALENNDLKMAKYYSHKALQNNLSNGGALSQLLVINDAEKNIQRANEAAQLSAHLWPAHALSMDRIAHYWIRQNQDKKAIAAWNVVLTQNYNYQNASVFTSLENTIFSIYEKITLQDNAKDLLTPYHKNPPTWWMHYFRYLVKNTKKTNNLKAVKQFYLQEVEHSPQFPIIHRNILLERLGKAHQLKEAYDLWLSSLRWRNSLDENVVSTTKSTDNTPLYNMLLYNGGFEGNIFNEGFAWIFGNMSHVHIYRDSISRLSGKYSLHITFNKWVTNYLGYLHQPLILSAGRTYTLNFNVRSRLSAEQGLVWSLYCINDFNYLNGELGDKIATSAPFKGGLEWQKKAFTFTIPDKLTCPAQGLFLDTTIGSETKRRVRGDIWFDDMALVIPEVIPEN
jgi:tetratricopeptide (TPR) repeat protein